MRTYDVYARVDKKNRVVAVDGGITIRNISGAGWVLIDTGAGDRFAYCQTMYLPENIVDENGNYRYKYDDGRIIERTQAERNADDAEITLTPSQLDRVAAQALYTALMTDTLIEEGSDNV